MQRIRNSFRPINKSIVTAVLTLFILHFMSIHGLASALVLCFEENGDVNVESVIGSILTIPAECELHADDYKDYSGSTVSISHSHHKDMALVSFCTEERQITRYDQQRTPAHLDGILNTSVEELPRSRVFQLASFIPPLIEDPIITSLQTVVLLN